MTNWEIAQNLLYLKLLLELSKNKYLASFYESAAYTVSVLDYPIFASTNLFFLPVQMQNAIEELIETGGSVLKENLERKVPKSLRIIARIPGLRPENAVKIYETLDVDSISDIKRVLNKGKIIQEFGSRFDEQIRRGLIEYEKGRNELSLFDGYSYAKSITHNINKDLKIDVAGSTRRGKEIVNNVDFVVCSSLDSFVPIILNLIPVKMLERKGSDSLLIKDRFGNILKFYFVEEKYFYSALQYFTGSKAHNKEILQIAKGRGFKTSKPGYVLAEAQSEEDFYKMLNMQYIPPEIREGEEEIGLARCYSLPKLLENNDVKGDLHMHSDFSDGTNTISDMKEEGTYHKYNYIAITDHSLSLKIAHGLSRERLYKEIEVIDKINMDKMEPYILKGIETEINFDGSVDTTPEDRSKLDVVIGALHNFSQSSYENTDRVIKAIKSGIINCIAHPTGRIIRAREPMNIDFGKVVEESASSNVALEVNLFPNRMDLSTGFIKQARMGGAKLFSIGTDAHNAGHLNFMEYGLKILRRAWVRPEEVLNTYDLEDLREILWTKKH